MGDTQENWTFLSGTNPLKTSGLPPPPPQEPRAAAEALGLVSRNLSLTLKTELLFKRAEGSSTLSHLILFQKEAGAFMQPESSLWACKGAWSFPRWVSPTSPPPRPRWLGGKESTCQCRRHRFDPWVWKIPWRRKWEPTPVFLSGKSHGQRRLVGYSPCGRKSRS